MQTNKLAKTIGLVMVLFVIVTTVGCGKKESKYVGRYATEPTKQVDAEGRPALGFEGFMAVLDLNSDGTYKFQRGQGSVSTGEWRVVKSEGEEDVEFTPPLFLSLRKTQKRGYLFYDAISGILVKER